VKALPVSETVGCADWPNSVSPQANGRPREASPFTLREQQVACLLVRGLSDRAIAEGLVISPKTVEKHVGAVLRKTGTAGRTAAVVRILAAGWLEKEFLDRGLPDAN